MLRSEIEGMTATVIELDHQLDSTTSRLGIAEARVRELEAARAALQEELLALRSSEETGHREREETHRKSGWRAAARWRVISRSDER